MDKIEKKNLHITTLKKPIYEGTYENFQVQKLPTGMGERTVHRDETYEKFSKSRNCPQGWLKELSTEMKLMKIF